MSSYLKPLKGQDFTLGSKLLDYGCWCRLRTRQDFSNEVALVPGHGSPVDALDEACKAWHQCKACTSKDFNSCNPEIAAYELWWDPQTQRIDCQFNPSDCQVSSYESYHSVPDSGTQTNQ